MRVNVSEYLIRLTQDPRAWRVFLVLVFTVPVLLVLPHARSLVVRNAVITAYLGDIRAPIDGRIEEIHQPPGTLVREGETAMTLRNDRFSRSQLARLEVLRERYGLSDPFLVQYWKWISGIAVGDFGLSSSGAARSQS